MPFASTLALALALASGVAHADLHALTDGRARVGERSFADRAHPERREGRLLLRQGVAFFANSFRADPLGPSREVRIDQALSRLQAARVALPEDVEVALYTAFVLASFERELRGGQLERRSEEARAEFLRARALDPLFEPVAVAWHLAQIETRLGHYAEAEREYLRVFAQLRLPAAPIMAPSHREEVLYGLFATPEEALVRVNLAEVQMLDQRLPESLAEYEAASALAARGTLTYTLVRLGLSLALERSGDDARALLVMRDALGSWSPPANRPDLVRLGRTHGALAPLHHPSVAFEPRSELFAYVALAHRAQAAEANEEDRVTHLREARVALRTFLATGGRASPYAPVATQRLAALEAERPALSAGP